MHTSLKFWSVARKAGVGALAVLSQAVAYGLLKDPWDKVATAVIAVATYAGIYAIRNVPPSGTGEAVTAEPASPGISAPLTGRDALSANQRMIAERARHKREGGDGFEN